MSLDNNLDIAIKKCDGSLYYENDWCYHIYPFTTENISGYIDFFDLKDKSLLTVGSSCDQALNAILKGIKDITVLDINPFVKYYYYLKMALILEVDMNDYLLFLRYKDYPKSFVDNKNVFNIDIFNKIKSTLRVLDFESYLFWDNLFQKFSPNTIREKLFFSDENKDLVIKNSNIYLNNSIVYNELKDRIKKIEPLFLTGNIEEINLDLKYDNIWLSNILTWNYSYEKIIDIFNNFYKYLNDNGMMLVSYLYDTNKDTKYDSNWCDIYNLEKIFSIFKEYDIDIKSFTGVMGILFQDDVFKKDSVLVCKKKVL